MNWEVIRLFPENHVDTEEGKIISDSRITYISKNFGIIGDALVYPWVKIKIDKILKVWDWCDTQHKKQHTSCVEVIFEGWIIRTTLENIEEILWCSIVEEENKRATM